MISICNKLVDTVASADNLMNEWAIFTIELEYDSKLIVCHTFDQSVYRGIHAFIYKSLSKRARNIELRQSLINSEYITVEIKSSGIKSRRDVLEGKYELIKANKTYMPYGYNDLSFVTMPERPYAEMLRAELIDDMDAQANFAQAGTNLGRAIKSVYCYDKLTGEQVKKYDSMKEAANDTGVFSSNISACCNGHIKSAGPFIWSFEDIPNVDPTQFEDRRFKRAKVLTPINVEERMNKFIKNTQT